LNFLLKRKHQVNGKWVFKTIIGLERDKVKLKAHLMAHSFEQKENINSTKTFVERVKWYTIKIVISS